MQVPFSYLDRQFSDCDAIFEDMKELVKKGKFTLGQPLKVFEEKFATAVGAKYAIGVGSGTDSLFLSLKALGVGEGDEVITTVNTFVATAGAIETAGAKIVFVDVEAATMNMNSKLIEAAITPKTKAIVPVHYAGVSCDMEHIMALAQQYRLWVIEDAAQGVYAQYRHMPLGSIGHLGCYSFHETKNYTAGGEGGALLINHPELTARAEIIREKGTNRTQFLMGQVDKYTWQEVGSSYLPGEFQAACLFAQLEQAEEINNRRLHIWHQYYEALMFYQQKGVLELPIVSQNQRHNGHLFFCKLPTKEQRDRFIQELREKGIQSTFHYVPLHSSPAGQRFGLFCGEDRITSIDSDRLCRLPVWFNMSDQQCHQVIEACHQILERF